METGGGAVAISCFVVQVETVGGAVAISCFVVQVETVGGAVAISCYMWCRWRRREVQLQR